MERLLLAVVLAAVAVVVAAVLARRTAATAAPAPTGGAGTVPAGVLRADFARPDAPVLVVLFSSATCDSCRGTWRQVVPLAGDAVAVVDVDWQSAGELHRRYGIEAVPTVLVVDAVGEVRASFVGPPAPAAVAAAVSEVLSGGASDAPTVRRAWGGRRPRPAG